MPFAWRIVMATTVAFLQWLAGLVTEFAECVVESLDRSPVVPIEELAMARKYGYVDISERRRVSWQSKVLGEDRASP